ncbi:MAG: tyrosine-type recombinase/integrase [Alteromonas sp.]|nr:tyrosine-type recombinase/integrase [Alteromonas sp.]
MATSKNDRKKHPNERLNDLTVKKLTQSGSYADGKGLYLKISPTGGKSWVFRYQFNGKRKHMGLGAYTEISLEQARERLAHWRRVLRGSIETQTPPCDPLEAKREIEAAQKREERKQVTFDEIAAVYIEANRPNWSNPKHAQQWANTLKTYATPEIGKLFIADIDTDDILNVLNPIWQSKNETATRLRGRIEKVIDYAKARKLRTDENPARWRGHLDAILPKPSKIAKTKHHPSLHHTQIGAFISELRSKPAKAARALEFLILTNTRTNEVTEAAWAEIDFNAKLWTIPAHRMKGRTEHRIPLSDRALELLEQQPKTSHLVFTNPKGDQLSENALANVIKRMNSKTPKWCDNDSRPIVPHGFRSTFRVWAGELTNYSPELIEFAMSHQLKDKAEAAYHRSTLPEKRRMLMQDWADRLSTPDNQSADVVPIGSAKNA